MKFRLWRGYHDSNLIHEIRKAWSGDYVLVLCPPTLVDYSFLGLLPCEELEFSGLWETADRERASLVPRASHQSFSEKPVLGLFSSGTFSASPRLVLYSKTNIESSLASIRGLFDCSRIQRIFCYPQPFHTFGLILGYLQSILFDIDLVTPEGKYSSESHLSWYHSVQPGLLSLGTPTHFHDLLTFIQANSLSPGPSYSAIVGGAPVSKALWKSLIVELNIEKPSVGYGATEACPGVTHLAPGLEPIVDGDIGSVLPHLRVERVQEEGLKFSGPSTCLAIVDPPRIEFPTSVILRDDIEEVGNRLVYKGRLDLVINRGGMKLRGESIEEAILSKLKVESLAVPLPDSRLSSELGILYKAQSGEAFILRNKILRLLYKTYGTRFRPLYVQAVSELPLNASAKHDRKKGAEILTGLCTRTLEYPMAFEKFTDVIPHRAPALWVDEVTWVDREEGECRVHINPEGHYCGPDARVRATSVVEWVAQSYAFILAAQRLEGLGEPKPPVKRAFLVAIRRFKIDQDLIERVTAKTFFVRVRRTHQVGPISLVQGVVLTPAEELVAEGQIRVFAD